MKTSFSELMPGDRVLVRRPPKPNDNSGSEFIPAAVEWISRTEIGVLFFDVVEVALKGPEMVFNRETGHSQNRSPFKLTICKGWYWESIVDRLNNNQP